MRTLFTLLVIAGGAYYLLRPAKRPGLKVPEPIEGDVIIDTAPRREGLDIVTVEELDFPEGAPARQRDPTITGDTPKTTMRDITAPTIGDRIAASTEGLLERVFG